MHLKHPNKLTKYAAWFVLTATGLLISACSGSGDKNQGTPTTAALDATTTVARASITPLPLAGATSLTAIPTQEDAAGTLLKLTIWWPESLSPIDRPEVAPALNTQIEAYGQAQEGAVDIEFRLKRAQDIGGIMSTLRTASNVAPGALPDITLLRREDLLTAVQSDLVYPLEGLIPSSILGDLYDSALTLGQINGQIYGLPYMVDVRHLAYQNGLISQQNALTSTFPAMLDRGIEWVFPAGRASGVSNTLYVQYLDVGGIPIDRSANTQVSTDALLQVMEFYEAAFAEGIISERILSYAAIDDYLTEFEAGNISAAVVTSTNYLALRDRGRRLIPASIPTQSGEPAGTVNGWMWVITTSNPNQQELAAEFLNWMMNSERQRQYAMVIRMLPSQKSALRALPDTMINKDLMDSILQNAIPALPDNAGSELGRAMQGALSAILTQGSTAEEAVQIVLDQLDN